MKDFSGQTFQSNGRKYTLHVAMRSIDGEVSASLDTVAIRSLEYESELNSLTISGQIEYVDAYGVVDKFLEKPGTLLDIIFVENIQEFDGPITIERLSANNRFAGTFVIDTIGILDRNSNQIEYKIEFVSSNIYKCKRTVDFSNYGKDPVPVFDILRQCIQNAGLGFDTDTFDKIKTNVKLNYITNGNDNMFTIVKYLFNKLYYYQLKDNSLKFIFWNEQTQQFQLFDIKDSSTLTGSYNIVLSMLKDKHESLIESEQNRLATVTRFPTSQNINALFDIQMSMFDYNKNAITQINTPSTNIVEYFNTSFAPDRKKYPKQFPLANSAGNNYVRRGAYWNNDINCYNEMIRILTKNNALMVETSGDINRKPAALVSVCIDRDTRQMAQDTHKSLDDMMTRYRGLEGAWITSRVRHYVYPGQNRYRQALVLVRNFTVDLKNKKTK